MLKKVLAGAVAAIFVTGSSAVFATAQDEVDKQVAKLLGDAISKRVAATVLQQQAGSGASLSEPNNIYGSYSRLRSDFSSAGFTTSSRTNIYVGGYDRSLSDKLILGAAINGGDTGSSSNAGIAIAGSDFSGIQPYVSYLFTNSFFVIANANYSRFSTTGASGTSSGGGITLNGVQRFDNFILKGRVGVSGTRSDFTTAGLTTKTSSTGYSGDLEGGYYFMPTLYGFVGVQVTGSNKPNSEASYARIGLEQALGTSAAVSVTYEGQAGNNLPTGTSAKSNTWTLAARIRF